MVAYRDMRAFLGKLKGSVAGSRRGAAAVEFALLAPIIAAVLAGIANYGMALFQKMELESAARAGAQMAIRDRSNTTMIENAVINATNLTLVAGDISMDPTCWCADVDASATCGVTCDDGDPTQYFMTVTVTKEFDYLFGFNYLIGADTSLSESVKVRTQ